MSFKNDLLMGKQKEADLCYQLMVHGYDPQLPERGVHTEYDILATHPEQPAVKYEVKLDVLSQATDRIAIECYKIIDGVKIPSGLTATQADYYAYCFEGDKQFYLIKPTDILQMLKEKEYLFLRDGGWKKCYKLALFDKDFFVSKCKIFGQ